MTAPTREQVLEWQQRAALAATRAVGPPGAHNLPEWKAEQMLHICALAYAAGKAEGVREENEACEQHCRGRASAHPLASEAQLEATKCANSIAARRPA